MDETIHINIGASQTDTHYIASYTVRVWPHLLASVNWILRNPISGNLLIQHGISITVINNLAIAVEGFIADIISEYLYKKDHLKAISNIDLDRMTWQNKRKLYNELFSKRLEAYLLYDGIETLISFRNNLAHGRTYTEYTMREIAGDEISDIESGNKVYQDLRTYLIKNRLLKPGNISSNVEVPWKIQIACHFVGLVKSFMENVLRENESDSKLGIETEFKLVYNIA